MRKQKIINIAVVLVSLIIGMALAEIALRYLTAFPINLFSNRVNDEDVGYRLSPDFSEADALGFRNPAGARAEILAIGDSHTYGNNVGSEESWPAQVASRIGLSVYNLGIGSYGILNYHALLHLYRREETKAAIVALYPANDFVVGGGNCHIVEKPSAFWIQERERLDLAWPSAANGCFKDFRDISWFSLVKQNSALIQLTGSLFNKLSDASDPIFDFPGTQEVLEISAVEERSGNMDLSRAEVAMLLEDFRKILRSWHEFERQGLKIGILVIPSRERVIYEFYKQNNRLDELDEGFRRSIESRFSLEEKLKEDLAESGFPFAFALEDVVGEFALAAQAGTSIYPDFDDDHPLGEGYAAYAVSAFKLYQQMNAAP